MIVTSIHGEYRPQPVEALIEALNATGKTDTAEAISAAISDKKDRVPSFDYSV